jgi:hypothetical protein
MFTRSLLRDLVAGILVAASLLGAAAASHAQVAFWQHSRPASHTPRVQAAGSWQIASVRAESRDHVQAQIDRMEARARADDRLSGRPAMVNGRDESRGRGAERANQGNDSRNDSRPTSVGPGWQAHGRGGR